MINLSGYGLLGEKLSHSFSKIIHEKLGRYTYDLLPMNIDELHSFLKKRDFKGVNVTIPYKREVMLFCDEIDETAKSIGAVNTIVNKEGKLIAYNTDFYGFLYTLRQNNIIVKNKIVYILGSGGTSKTIKACMEYLNAKEIVIVSRNSSQNKITYEEALQRKDAQIIVNATPNGMYPNNYNLPIEIDAFKNLYAVIDVIYNPLNTRLLQKAKQKDIIYVNGLQMLVAQAVYAARFFLDEEIDEEKIDIIYREILSELCNIVFVGMPSAGKSTIAKELSKLLNRQFVDIDSLIEEKENMKIPQIFETFGEEYFRKLEHDIIKEISKKTNLVIATGGGAILDKENIINLKQNGLILFIDRPIENLIVGGNRPLSKDEDAIKKLYDDRYNLYLNASDFVVENNGDINKALNLAKERYYEAIFKGKKNV